MIDAWAKMTDEQLCAVGGRSGQAMEELVRRCQRLVRICTRPYFLAGAEPDDLYQEGMLALLHAAASYDPARGVPFQSFAALCIRRRLISEVRAAGAPRNRVLNDSIPLCTFALDAPPAGALSAAGASPEELLIGAEEAAELRARLSDVLSPMESRVLELYLEGISYREIAASLGRPCKAVDNAVQRIRRKLVRLQTPASTAEGRSQ